ncbi:unnamed protein product [Meloidogyne enterolobii]|uniref:Uncharacterized protein n=1 Tax=Meloidogyne enterolobii TaxID=390850 RepID=A0ACB1A1H5_MELEN
MWRMTILMVNIRTRRTGQPTTIRVVIQTMQTFLHLITKWREALSILLVAGSIFLAESVSYSSYSEESNVSFSTSSASTSFSLVGKTVRVVSFKQSNMRLNPENIQESNVTEVPRSSQHKDESSSQDEYFMATNELSSNSSEMYFSDAVSEEKVPRLMPEYNLYSTQQEFRNCAVEACNMNTFLQLIECSFPQECSEQILNNLFFDYHQLDVKKCGRIQLLLLDGKVMVFFCIFLSFFKNVRHFVTIYF